MHKDDMRSFKEFLKENKEAVALIVKFKNTPSKKAPKLLFESFLSIEEGKLKNWGDGFSYRLDRRPDHMGGDQLHIYGRKNQGWAYRSDGSKSEVNKYTSPATNTVIDIVSDIFSLDRSNIKETVIVSASEEELLIEVGFT